MGTLRRLLIVLIAAGILAAPALTRTWATGWQKGTASWYNASGATASGHRAHYGFADCGSGGGPCWPMGTKVKFCYHHRCVFAYADDHGPYVAGRDFDLNGRAAKALGMIRRGVVQLHYRVAHYG